MRAMAAKLALLLAVAGVLAGFLGMHILNGHHAGHTSSAVTVHTAALDTVADGATMGSAHSMDAHGCGCSGPCPESSETHPSCVPMQGALTLDASPGPPLVLPPAPPVMRLTASGGVVQDPRSLSLHELCISRC